MAKAKETMISPSELLEKRTALVQEFGRKIMLDPDDSVSLTTDEKAAQIVYRAMTEELSKDNPAFKEAEEVMKTYAKHGVNSVFGLAGKYITKIFLVLLAILVLLALLKFVFA